MSKFLTTKQVQDLLQVDRTTIYRMINDGRLSGVKVGQQWRFARAEIEAILTGEQTEAPVPEIPVPQKRAITPEVLPTHCIQVIQDVFAEVAEVGSVTTHLNGEPITQFSNCNTFCGLVRASQSGKQACKQSWQDLANIPGNDPQDFFTCHAGLQYARANIHINENRASILIAGQFYTQAPDTAAWRQEITALAKKHQIETKALLAASQKVPVLDSRLQQKIGHWLQHVANAFAEIGRERAELMGRLQQIAEMSTLKLS